MSEPTLEDIEDYDTLKGEKRRVVMAVVVASLIIGVIYVIASSVYSGSQAISADKTFQAVPMR